MSVRPFALFVASAALLAASAPLRDAPLGAAASQDAAPTLKFEVASVKPSTPQSVRGSEGGPGTKDPTHYRFQSVTLRDLVAIAYHVDYFQITSKSALDRDRFDLGANVPEKATRAEFRTMMRALLEERFHFQAHVESREFAGYELVVAKTGLRLKESGASAAAQPEKRAPGDEGFPDLPVGRPGLISNQRVSGGSILVRLKAQQQTVSSLTGFLHAPGEEPIVDKTGLTAKYDFTLEYANDLPTRDGEARTSDAPSIFVALQQQLGLQLIAKKLPFDVVVVEAFDRLPTGN